MVGVVQLVERQIVVLVVGGSSPFAHPILCRGIAKAVRHKTLTLACVGSSPATPAIDPLAQLAEHLTFNQGVRSSNLRWVTIWLTCRSRDDFGFFRYFVLFMIFCFLMT